MTSLLCSKILSPNECQGLYSDTGKCFMSSDVLIAPHPMPPASVSAPASTNALPFAWNIPSLDACFGYLFLLQTYLAHLLRLL